MTTKKTYNLISGSLYQRRGEEDCFCALGIFAAEKGVPLEELEVENYEHFRKDEFADGLAKMADYLMPLIGEDRDEYTDDTSVVYSANDRCTGGAWTCGAPGCICEALGEAAKPAVYTVTADQIKEALRLAGVDVELNDMRAER